MSTRPMSLPEPVADYLRRHTILALGTTDEEGVPHVAPLFYALLPDGDIVFISHPHTRHIREMTVRPRVALSVYGEPQQWQRIQGFQGHGEGYELPPARHRLAWETYVRAFPFLNRVIRSETPSVEQVRSAFQDARWYAVRLTWVRLIDNRQEFSHKDEWRRRVDGTWEKVR